MAGIRRDTAAPGAPGRIVVFSPSLREIGGAQKRSRLLVEGLADRGWDVRVITRAATYRRPRLTRARNLTVLEIPGFGRRRLGMVLFLAAAIPLGVVWSRPGAKLMAVQLMSTSVAAGTCSLLRRRPYLALSTTSGSLSEAAYIRSASFSGLRRRLLERASFLVAQTQEVASTLQELIPGGRIAVLPNPVEPVELPPALNGRPLAFFAGRFSAEKDLPCLLEAWARVVPETDGARLLLVGEGGDYRSVEAEIRNQVADDSVLSSSTEFTGWVADLAPFFSSIDVFVLPSVSEGMSNVLLEACAWNRLIVASDIPANRAVLGGDYPLLFETSDPDSLADALKQAFSPQPDILSRALDGVRRAARRSSPDEVIPRLEQMLHAADSSRN